MTSAAMDSSSAQETDPALDFELVIVGSGFSGIGTAIKLKEMGIEDFVILERENDLGGTWRDNTYPGLTVDIPSLTYSYAFEPNPDWSRLYSPGAELKQYADHCAKKYDVMRHIQYEKAVESAAYDETNNVWITHTADGGTYRSRFLVSACGLLVNPKMPDIEGIETFEGKVIHTARWDHDYDLTGDRVAVIGTGATAIQLIPEIVDQVERLDVYQRTPIWLLPKLDGPIPEGWKRAFRRLPLLQRAARVLSNTMTELFLGVGSVHYKQFPWLFRWIEKRGVGHIKNQVNDPEIRRELTPDYSFFCKRPSFSNVYFPVFNRDDVELVTNPIAKITKDAVISQDGTVREIDTLICATGFNVLSRGAMPTFEVYGKDALELGDFWQQNRFQAYEGASIPRFPNYFMILGPYAIASASYFGMIDTQVRHLTRCLGELRRRGANYIEVKQSAHDRNFEQVLDKRRNNVLFHGNCTTSNSYYFDKNGDTPMLRPVTHMSMWMRSHTFSLDDYEYHDVASGSGAASSTSA